MPKFRFTKTFKSYYDLIVEADSLDEALKIANDSDEWEEDYELTPCILRTWAKLDADGETEEVGVLTEEQLP